MNPAFKDKAPPSRSRVKTTRLFEAITRDDHFFAGIVTARFSHAPIRPFVTRRGSTRLVEWGLSPAFDKVLLGIAMVLAPLLYTAGYAIKNPRITLGEAFRELFSFVGFGAVAVFIPIGFALLLWGLAPCLGCRWIEVSADRRQVQIGSWRPFRKRARTTDAETWSSHAWIQLVGVLYSGTTALGRTRSTCHVVVCAPSPDGIGDVVVYAGSGTEEAARAHAESLVNLLPRTRTEPMRFIGYQPRIHRKLWIAFD